MALLTQPIPQKVAAGQVVTIHPHVIENLAVENRPGALPGQEMFL